MYCWMAKMSTLEIRLLGTPQSWLGGELVTELRSDKVRALLAYLVVESDQPHRREKLAGLLWPGYPETSARASLRRALADLRSAIDDAHASPPYLDINRQAIQFNQGSDAWVDVSAFSKLARAPQGISEQTITSWEEAVEIYRGEFMDGFSIPDSPGFEEWLLQSREGLKRQLLDTLGRLVKSRPELKKARPGDQMSSNEISQPSKCVNLGSFQVTTTAKSPVRV